MKMTVFSICVSVEKLVSLMFFIPYPREAKLQNFWFADVIRYPIILSIFFLCKQLNCKSVNVFIWQSYDFFSFYLFKIDYFSYTTYPIIFPSLYSSLFLPNFSPLKLLLLCLSLEKKVSKTRSWMPSSFVTDITLEWIGPLGNQVHRWVKNGKSKNLETWI